jgi:hypothetical protein
MFEVWFTPVKRHTPECAQIEQFVATLVPVKTKLAGVLRLAVCSLLG